MDGWMDGWKSRVKDCLQQSKMLNFGYFKKWEKIQNKLVKFEIPNFECIHCTKEGAVNEGQISHVRSIGYSIYGQRRKVE